MREGDINHTAAELLKHTAAELLKLADQAALAEDWSQVCQYLHQRQQLPECAPAELSQWQDLSLRALEQGDFHTRWDVAKLIAKSAPDLSLTQRQEIIALLEAVDDDEGLLWFLVRILGDLGDPNSISALVALLQRDPEEDITAAIVTALGQIGAPAIPAVCALLDEPQTRPAAVQTLAQIRHPAAVAPLTRAVEDANPEIRALAITTLADAQHPEAQPILIAALEDTAAAVRRAALRGLGSSSASPSAATILKIGELLWDINLSVRKAAVLTLGHSRLSEAADLLCAALQSPETPPVLKPQLIGALGQTETAVGLAHLRRYVKTQCDADSPSGVPVAAIATSLGRIESPQLVPQALELLELLLACTPIADPDRCVIATSLGQLSPPTPRQLELLIAMLAEANTSLRLHVIAALRKLAPAEALQQLRAIATAPQTAPGLRQVVNRALQDWERSILPQP